MGQTLGLEQNRKRTHSTFQMKKKKKPFFKKLTKA